MNLKASFFIALGILIASLTFWEFYWRAQGYYPTLKDDKDLWALQRARVETAETSDVLIMGSSRAYFDFQVDEFENLAGRKPIQLACTGSSPLPVFHDIVWNTDFNGTVIIGVTPGLFFSTTFPMASPWQRAQLRVDYYRDRTYAQRLNYYLSIPLQQSLVFLAGDEEEWDDSIDLKSLINRLESNERTGQPQKPPFYYFGDVNLDRNMRMTERTVIDSSFANSIKKVWYFFGGGAPPPDKASTMKFFLDDLEKFKDKGGNAILVRLPSSGGVRAGENIGVPRKDFWDKLVIEADVPHYHFEDYEQLKDLQCPEESHLSGEDADYFTREMVRIMKSDGVLPNF